MSPLFILQVLLYSSALATGGPSISDVLYLCAAKNGYEGLFQALLEDESANLAGNNYLVIRCAAEHGHEKCLEPLTAHPSVNPTADDYWIIRWAAEHGHEKCLELLIARPEVDLTANDYWIIRWAAERGDEKCLALLIARPSGDLTANNNWITRWAAEHGHAKCLELLLARPEVNPAAQDNCAICWAAKNGHEKCLELLLADPRVDPAAQDNYAIRTAAEDGYPDCVRLLLAHPRVDPAAVKLPPPAFPFIEDMKRYAMNFIIPKMKPDVASRVNGGLEITDLIRLTQTCKDGDLKAVQQLDSAALSDAALDILISRNQAFPAVFQHLLVNKLARLGVPATVLKDPNYADLLNLVRLRGFWAAGQLCELTETFIRVKNIRSAFGGHATIVTAHAHGLAA